jgi:hypothetical protein
MSASRIPGRPSSPGAYTGASPLGLRASVEAQLGASGGATGIVGGGRNAGPGATPQKLRQDGETGGASGYPLTCWHGCCMCTSAANGQVAARPPGRSTRLASSPRALQPPTNTRASSSYVPSQYYTHRHGLLPVPDRRTASPCPSKPFALRRSFRQPLLPSSCNAPPQPRTAPTHPPHLPCILPLCFMCPRRARQGVCARPARHPRRRDARRPDLVRIERPAHHLPAVSHLCNQAVLFSCWCTATTPSCTHGAGPRAYASTGRGSSGLAAHAVRSLLAMRPPPAQPPTPWKQQRCFDSMHALHSVCVQVPAFALHSHSDAALVHARLARAPPVVWLLQGCAGAPLGFPFHKGAAHDRSHLAAANAKPCTSLTVPPRTGYRDPR